MTPFTRVLLVTVGTVAVLATAMIWRQPKPSDPAPAPVEETVDGTTNIEDRNVEEEPIAAEEPGAAAAIVSHKKVERQGTPDIGGPFALIDHEGNPVTDQDLLGRPLLVAFGYTNCPDVCQMMLQNISEALDQVGDRVTEIVPLFISFDPDRDTPEVLAAHLENFHPAIRGLTGTPENVADALKVYHVYAKKSVGKDPENYIMEHSSFIYLMDHTGKYKSHFSHPAAPEALALAIRTALDE